MRIFITLTHSFGRLRWRFITTIFHSLGPVGRPTELKIFSFKTRIEVDERHSYAYQIEGFRYFFEKYVSRYTFSL